MAYLGDIAEDATLDFKFTTVSGAPATLSGTPALSVYKANGTTQTTAGITLTVDFDSVTGLNHARIDTSADAFYATGNDYQVVITTGTVGGTSVVGYVVGEFSIENRTEAIADAVWDEVLTGATHNIATSAGRRLRDITSNIIRSGTAQGGSTASITLDSGASATDGIYDPGLVEIIGGTGVGQSRLILAYNGTTKVATVDRDWKTEPDNTSEFLIKGATTPLHVNEGLAQAGTSTTITLNSLASATDDVYNNQTVWIRAGTGQDQSRVITDYSGTTKVATVRGAWTTTPGSDSAYVILPLGSSSGSLGSGASSVTLTFTEDDNVTAIADADVWVTSDSGGNSVVAGTNQTDSSGQVTFLLDDGVTYYAWLQKDGITSIQGESFVASAD